MEYQAYRDGALFFDTTKAYEGYQVTAASVELKIGAAGAFTITVAPQNIAYGAFNRLVDSVAVYRDGSEIFYGRVYGVSSQFNSLQTIECEGYLAVLNDSLFPPVTWESSLELLVAAIVANHNSQCPGWPLEVGQLDFSDDYTYRAYEQYKSSKERLDDLRDSYGGYFEIRHEDDVAYLDWIDYDTESDAGSQSIDFGSNLLDLTQEATADDIITVLIPIGAEYTETTTDEDTGEEIETTANVDITSVNGGLNYVVDEDAVATFGYIWGTYEWEDVTEPENLLVKAWAYLAEQSKSRVTIDVTAVDLANIDDTIDHFWPGAWVQVTSEPHGIDDAFLCTYISFNLLDPSEDKITLGGEREGYVSSAAENLTNTTKTLESVRANYATNADLAAVLEQVTTNSTLISQNAEAIELNATSITELGDQVTELSASLEETAEGLTATVSKATTSLILYYCLWESATEAPPGVGEESDECEWTSEYPGASEDGYVWYSIATVTIAGDVSYSDPALFTGDPIARDSVASVQLTAETLQVSIETVASEVVQLAADSLDIQALLAVWALAAIDDQAIYDELVRVDPYGDDTLYLLAASTVAPTGVGTDGEDWVSDLPSAASGYYIWYSGVLDSGYSEPQLLISEVADLQDAYDELYASGGTYALLDSAARALVGADDDDLDTAYDLAYVEYEADKTAFSRKTEACREALAEAKALLQTSAESASLKADYQALVSSLSDTLDQINNTLNMYFTFSGSGLLITAGTDEGDELSAVQLANTGLYLIYGTLVAAAIATNENTGTTYLSVANALVENILSIGDFAVIPSDDGSVSVTWQGDE